MYNSTFAIYNLNKLLKTKATLNKYLNYLNIVELMKSKII